MLRIIYFTTLQLIVSFFFQWIIFLMLGINDHLYQQYLFDTLIELFKGGDLYEITMLIPLFFIFVCAYIVNIYIGRGKIIKSLFVYSVIGIGVILFVPLFFSCFGFGCITYTIFLFLSGLYWLFVLSISPKVWILIYPFKLFANKPTFVLYLILLGVSSVIWSIGSLPMVLINAQTKSITSPYLNKAMQGITHLEPSYKPKNFIRKVDQTYSSDFVNENLTIDGVLDHYSCTHHGGFMIVQGAISMQKVKNIEEFKGELNKVSYTRVNLESSEPVQIKQYQGIYYGGKLYYFTEDSIIKIYIYDCTKPEEIKNELIKIAESLTPK